MKKNILITWLPKSGKTTLLKKILENYERKVWFWTDEIRVDNERVGFEIVTHSRNKKLLAHINHQSATRVGKYGVDMEAISHIIPEIELHTPVDILYIDEIGEMELSSKKFTNLVRQYLDSPNTCIMTLSEVFTDNFTEEIKRRNDIMIIKINRDNHLEQEKYIHHLILNNL